jgi:hypothetical protein
MGNLVRTPIITDSASQRANVIVSDNRFQSIAQLYYLIPGDQGYESIEQPSAGTKKFSIEIVSDIPTMINISSLGYDVSDPFIMNGAVLNNQEDDKIELIRSAYIKFKRRFDRTFLQTEGQFSQDPQFFNFQNFFAKNAFAMSLVESLIDTRNSLVYNSNTIQQEDNQVLLQNSFFGSTPSNLSLIKNYYENILSYPMPVVQNQQKGLLRIVEYNQQVKRNSAPYSDVPIIAVNNPLININSNESSPKITLKRNVVLQRNMKDGIIIGAMNNNANGLDNAIFSFTENPINPMLYVTYFINPFNFKRIGVDYATILSSRRSIRKSNIGFGIGGNHEIQNRTPFINNIEKTKSFFMPNFIKSNTQVNVKVGKVIQMNDGQSQIPFINL